MRSTHRFPITDESQVGEVRRFTNGIYLNPGHSEHDGERLAIIITELGRNLIRHAGGGELLIREILHPTNAGLEIMAVDHGPGISNVGEALRDGFSTHGTSGTGLGAVRRQSDVFDIFSQSGKGTTILARVGAPAGNTDKFNVGAVSVALVDHTPCGDAWDFMDQKIFRLFVADGLGHGPIAETAAREALTIFRKHAHTSPAATLELVHLALAKTRGAAGSMVEIDRIRREITSAGIGNVSMRLVSETGARSLISDNGTLGGSVRKMRDAAQAWEPRTILIMHSDGLSSNWKLSDYPGLASRDAGIIAAVLYRDHRRERDDSTVVVLKEIP